MLNFIGVPVSSYFDENRVELEHFIGVFQYIAKRWQSLFNEHCIDTEHCVESRTTHA